MVRCREWSRQVPPLLICFFNAKFCFVMLISLYIIKPLFLINNLEMLSSLSYKYPQGHICCISHKSALTELRSNRNSQTFFKIAVWGGFSKFRMEEDKENSHCNDPLLKHFCTAAPSTWKQGNMTSEILQTDARVRRGEGVGAVSYLRHYSTL